MRSSYKAQRMLRYYLLGSSAERNAARWRHLFPWFAERYDRMAIRYFDQVGRIANG